MSRFGNNRNFQTAISRSVGIAGDATGSKLHMADRQRLAAPEVAICDVRVLDPDARDIEAHLTAAAACGPGLGRGPLARDRLPACADPEQVLEIEFSVPFFHEIDFLITLAKTMS